MKTDVETILDILEKAQARIEELQATVLQQEAMINAILLCLRDQTQADPQGTRKAVSALPTGGSSGIGENQ